MHITLQTVEFTSIGLLKLLPGEHNDIVLEDAALIVPDCTLGAPNTDITGERGRLQVTSKRIIWLGKTKSSSDRKRSCCFALKCVERVKMSTGVMTTIGLAPKLNILLKLGTNNSPAVTGDHIVKISVMGDRSKVAAVQERLSLLLDRSIQQSENALPEADVAALENMTVMGFDHERAHCALVCTQNDINAAIQWLQDHRLESTVQIHNHAMQACKAAAAVQGQDAIAEQLSSMGFSTQAIQASRDTTRSNEIGVLMDWLHSSDRGSGQYGNTRGMSVPSYQLTHNPRYPKPQFGETSEPLRSHPVQVYPSIDDPAVASVCNPYHSHEPASPPAVTSHASGMEAIVAAKRATATQIGQDVRSGFRDLQALRESGERLAKLAADLSSRTASARSQGDLEAGLANDLVDLGIISPVTKTSAGKQYHEQLSRELAHFLQQHLGRERGMMVLHDVFCLFNRARGLELVSPDDLRTAAELFERLKLPLSFRVFPSGVAVVQDSSWSDDAVCSKIVDILNTPHHDVVDASLGRGIAPTQYALEAAMPLAVAMEQLLLAERKGFLCRDDTACGLYFYRNIFPELSV